MNRLGVTLLALVTALGAATCTKPGDKGAGRRPATAPPRATGPVKLTLTTLPEPGAATLSIRVGWRAGSADDPPGKEGLTCLTAAMLLEGGTRKRTYGELRKQLYPMAAELTVACGKDYVAFVGRVHSDHAVSFLALLGDVLAEPRWDPAAFKRLRQEALDTVGRRLRFDHDEALSLAVLDQLIYRDHPFRHPATGTLVALESLTLADVKKQRHRVLTQERLLAGLAGALPPGVRTTLTRILKRLPARGEPFAALPKPRPVKGIQVHIVQKAGSASVITIGLPTVVTRAHPDYAALALAASYLGEHRKSFGLLQRSLSTVRGLNHGNYAYAEHFEEEEHDRLPAVGTPRGQQRFAITLHTVAPERTHFALRFALRELARLVEHGIPAKDFERARTFLAGYTHLWTQTSSRRLGHAMDSRFYGAPGYPLRLRSDLMKLTPARFRAALKRHLTPRNLKVVVISPQAKVLASAIRKELPSPISYGSQPAESILATDKLVSTYQLAPAKVDVVVARNLFEN